MKLTSILKTWKKINNKKVLLLIIVVSIVSLLLVILSGIVFSRHEKDVVSGISIITGPTLTITLLGLIPSIIALVISIWFMYLFFKDGLKDFLNKKTNISYLNFSLYILIIILLVISLIGISIGFSEWNIYEVIIISNS